MITWGISANSHDAALAVFVNDQLEFASHAERYSGKKNDADLNFGIISAAKKYGLPDKVVWYESPIKKSARQLIAGQGWKFNENNIKQYLSGYDIKCAFSTVNHHHSHAAGGYYTSGFTDATVLCIDAIGEFETLTVWEGQHSSLRKRESVRYPHSVGLWYSAMTHRIGLKPNEDEYILMGMAAYGNPDRLKDRILNDFFYSVKGTDIKLCENLHRGCKTWAPELHTQQDLFDIAAATQAVYEIVFDGMLRSLSQRYTSRNLVLMGGCALNCSANRIAPEYFDRIWIMPSPGDSGSAIGSVLAYYNMPIAWPGPYLGEDIPGAYPVQQTLEQLLSKGIAGVASGRAEFGPRALGNRSLIADPRTLKNKTKVNTIKQRQQFRPFAPAILAEHAQDYFDGAVGPYMQSTARVLQPKLIPAVVHADGTARVQSVAEDCGSGIRQLLEAWYAETGCPVLLNTSLNIKGQPIVNTRPDADRFETAYAVKVFS